MLESKVGARQAVVATLSIAQLDGEPNEESRVAESLVTDAQAFDVDSPRDSGDSVRAVGAVNSSGAYYEYDSKSEDPLGISAVLLDSTATENSVALAFDDKTVSNDATKTDVDSALQLDSQIKSPKSKTAVIKIPLHLVAQQIARTSIENARQGLTNVPVGEMHRQGRVWTIPFVFEKDTTKARQALVDTGALPTLCKASALAEIDPDFRSKLIPCSAQRLVGLQGQAKVLGIYQAAIILPHAELSLKLDRVEFLVAEDYSMSYEFILGQDVGSLYRFNLIRPAVGRTNAHLRVGSHSQLLYLEDAGNSSPQ